MASDVIFGPRELHASVTRWRVITAVGQFAHAKPLGMFGLVVMAGLVGIMLVGPWIAPYDYDKIDIVHRLHGPSRAHLFGTDEMGRDIFSRVIFGARTSVMIGFGSVLISTVVASVAGITSGFARGWTDTVIQRFVEVCLAFPGLIFIIFMVSVFGASQAVLIVALGIVFSASATRLIRSYTLTITEMPYIEAARSLGCSDGRIICRHILPNVLVIIIVSASVQVGAIILVESSLAFLGFGTRPPFPSWGRMLQDGQTQMRDHPHLVLFPGAAIALTVYSMNMAGDALRDWLDPRLRH